MSNQTAWGEKPRVQNRGEGAPESRGFKDQRCVKREDKPRQSFQPRTTRSEARDRRELRLEHHFINVCRDMMPEKMFNDAMKMAKNRVKESELQQIERRKRVQEAEVNRTSREERISARSNGANRNM